LSTPPSARSTSPSTPSTSTGLAQWRARTGLPVGTEGDVEVPGALVPVVCRPEHDYAADVEPNVRVRHALDRALQ
jgi:hypothetical protein